VGADVDSEGVWSLVPELNDGDAANAAAVHTTQGPDSGVEKNEGSNGSVHDDAASSDSYSEIESEIDAPNTTTKKNGSNNLGPQRKYPTKYYYSNIDACEHHFAIWRRPFPNIKFGKPEGRHRPDKSKLLETTSGMRYVYDEPFVLTSWIEEKRFGRSLRRSKKFQEWLEEQEKEKQEEESTVTLSDSENSQQESTSENSQQEQSEESWTESTQESEKPREEIVHYAVTTLPQAVLAVLDWFEWPVAKSKGKLRMKDNFKRLIVRVFI